MNLGEAPVTVCSNNGGNELSQTEREHQGEGRALHEEEAMRTGDEDESLRDNGNLEVDDHVKLRVIVIAGSGRGTVREGNAKGIEEPCRADGNGDKCNATIDKSAL